MASSTAYHPMNTRCNEAASWACYFDDNRNLVDESVYTVLCLCACVHVCLCACVPVCLSPLPLAVTQVSDGLSMEEVVKQFNLPVCLFSCLPVCVCARMHVLCDMCACAMPHANLLATN